LIIASSQPWVYLQPAQPILTGQKWLGVTFEPYDGCGAYVTGVYEGSPAQRVGLEVGDVIVSIDGVDATQLGNVIQAANGTVVLQVLSGRTGALVQQQVNLIR
jgi:predicted metalloprotease with PDZ domain